MKLSGSDLTHIICYIVSVFCGTWIFIFTFAIIVEIYFYFRDVNSFYNFLNVASLFLREIVWERLLTMLHGQLRATMIALFLMFPSFIVSILCLKGGHKYCALRLENPIYYIIGGTFTGGFSVISFFVSDRLFIVMLFITGAICGYIYHHLEYKKLKGLWSEYV